MIEQSIVSIIALAFNLLVGVAVGAIAFFIKRLIINIDKLNDNFHNLDKELSRIQMLAEINTKSNETIKTKIDIQEKELGAVWRNIDSLKSVHEQ